MTDETTDQNCYQCAHSRMCRWWHERTRSLLPPMHDSNMRSHIEQMAEITAEYCEEFALYPTELTPLEEKNRDEYLQEQASNLCSDMSLPETADYWNPIVEALRETNADARKLYTTKRITP